MRVKTVLKLLGAALLVLPLLAGCGLWGVPQVKRAAFTSKEFGVPVSPRVTWAAHPPKGGGRYVVGEPYVVRGKTYVPQADPRGYVASGSASWYGADFHGRRTANGEIFGANAITGASPVLPLPSYVRVTNRDNGRSMIVRVNDRGPYLHGRVMDLSYRAAKILGYADKGVGNITVHYLGRAPLEGDDTGALLASVAGAPLGETGGPLFAFNFPGLGGGAPQKGGRATVFDGFFNLFGYAPQTRLPDSAALRAAERLATLPPALVAWQAAVDLDGRTLEVVLGTFSASRADALASQVAILGDVRLETSPAGTRLRLLGLKPGVLKEDMRNLLTELGLTGVIL